MGNKHNEDEAGIETVLLYVRVSTEEQAKEGLSLEAQLDRLRLFARARGWKVGGEYVDDGYSGTTTKRPGYQNLLKALHVADAMLVAKMDRAHRNQTNFTSMMSALKKAGKAFVSLNESLDTSTAMGRFCMDLMARLHQLESEVTGERVREHHDYLYNTTSRWNGPAPYGFERHNGTLRINAEEAAVVKELARLRLASPKASAKAIASTTNRRGLLTRTGRPWSSERVREVLAHPAIAGLRIWSKHAVARHPAIISLAMYHQVHKLMAVRRRKARPDLVDTRSDRRYAKLRRHLENGDFTLRKPEKQPA